MSEPGLDHAFLQFIGATPESQKHWQRFYVPLFVGCRDALDVGCGSGDFVELLAGEGIAARGVDSDPQCCVDARARGLHVDQADALEYLRAAHDAQFDGMFSAHLVEHMPYEAVLALVREAWRVLRPGGRLVLATPNARALFAHLETFYMHFGHVSFYHPELLRFFLQYAGFTRVETGVNTTMPAGAVWGGNLRGRVTRPGLAERARLAPLDLLFMDTPPNAPQTGAEAVGAGGDWPAHAGSFVVPWYGRPLPELPPASDPAPFAPVQFDRTLPLVGGGLLGRLSHRVKNFLARWLVLPYLDDIVAQYNARLLAQQQQLAETYAAAHGGTDAAAAALAESTNAALSAVRVELNETHARADRLARRLGEALVQQAEFGARLDERVTGVDRQINREISSLQAAYTQIGEKLQALAAEFAGTTDRLVDALEALDPPWECYVVGHKADD